MKVSNQQLERVDFQIITQNLITKNLEKTAKEWTHSPNPKQNQNLQTSPPGEYVEDPITHNIVFRLNNEINLREYGIFKRFAKTTFSEIERIGLPDNASIRQNYEIVKDYAENLYENIENGTGLIMLGDCGTLKTTFSIAIMRKLIDENKGNKASCYFIPMTSLMDMIFTMANLNKEEASRFEKKIRNTKLLVIDDLGSENTDVSWVKSKIDSIITERYNRMLPCIISSNLTFDELQNTYASRIIDRLRSTNKALVFCGKSVRP